MSHLIILMLVLNLVAGTVVFLYASSTAKKYRRPFFKTLQAYILSFNGLVIVYFSYQYILINIFGQNQFRIMEYPAVSLIILFLVYSAEIGMTVSLFRLMTCLNERKMSGKAKWFFVVWVILFGAASVYSLIIFFQKTDWRLFYWIHAGWMFSISLIILSFLVAALLPFSRDGSDRNSLRPLVWFFLAGYGAFTFSNLDFYLFHSGIQKYYDPVVLLLINLCPLLWLRFFFEKENPATVMAAVDEKKLIRFCETYGISRRERDVVQQVLNGKSNEDIENILFISKSTVKNHLYNVFQKTGVKSRSDLIHRILRFEG